MSTAAAGFWLIVAGITTGYAVEYLRGHCEGSCGHGAGAELIAGSVLAIVGVASASALTIVAALARRDGSSDRRLAKLVVAQLAVAAIWLVLLLA